MEGKFGDWFRKAAGIGIIAAGLGSAEAQAKPEVQDSGRIDRLANIIEGDQEDRDPKLLPKSVMRGLHTQSLNEKPEDFEDARDDHDVSPYTGKPTK